MAQKIERVVIRHEGGIVGDLTPEQIKTFEGPWARRVGKENISHISPTNHDPDLVAQEGCQEVVIFHSSHVK